MTTVSNTFRCSLLMHMSAERIKPQNTKTPSKQKTTWPLRKGSVCVHQKMFHRVQPPQFTRSLKQPKSLLPTSPSCNMVHKPQQKFTKKTCLLPSPSQLIHTHHTIGKVTPCFFFSPQTKPFSHTLHESFAGNYFPGRVPVCPSCISLDARRHVPCSEFLCCSLHYHLTTFWISRYASCKKTNNNTNCKAKRDSQERKPRNQFLRKL